ncbi:MAG: cell division protein ZapA [Gammaproteobacteria bacterium]|nr:cell division protein ZapA [Gammaproteobacteria bacterium]
MNDETKAIQLHILGKDYLVGCTGEEKEALFTAAKYLDDKMREVRDSGRVIGTERIAVITALNITHDYLINKSTLDNHSHSSSKNITRMLEKIDLAIQDDKEG